MNQSAIILLVFYPIEWNPVLKKGMVKNSIEGALGFFSLVNISDLDEMTNTTLSEVY